MSNRLGYVKNPFVIAIVAILIMLCTSCSVKSVDDYYIENIEVIADGAQTVTISIRCDTVLNNLDKLDSELKKGDYIPSDGVILQQSTYALRENNTVFDALEKATKYNNFQLESQKGYIKGIAYLYEFSCGPLSGWIYKVNGESQNVGCNNYILKDGDVVEWLYTCDLGRDMNSNAIS